MCHCTSYRFSSFSERDTACHSIIRKYTHPPCDIQFYRTRDNSTSRDAVWCVSVTPLSGDFSYTNSAPPATSRGMQWMPSLVWHRNKNNAARETVASKKERKLAHCSCILRMYMRKMPMFSLLVTSNTYLSCLCGAGDDERNSSSVIVTSLKRTF